MAVTSEIALFDWVELLEPIDEVPAGARGGLIEFLEPDLAMVDVMEPLPDGVPVVVVPLSALRGLGPERPPARG